MTTKSTLATEINQLARTYTGQHVYYVDNVKRYTVRRLEAIKSRLTKAIECKRAGDLENARKYYLGMQ